MKANCETIRIPTARVAEDSGRLHIYVDLPGVPEKELELRLEEGLLSVRGGAKQCFEQQFRLGEDLDPESIQAVLKLGVLTIDIERRDLSRRVPVRTG